MPGAWNDLRTVGIAVIAEKVFISASKKVLVLPGRLSATIAPANGGAPIVSATGGTAVAEVLRPGAAA